MPLPHPLLLALLLALAPAAARAEPVARVAALRFEGVRSIPRQALASQLLTQGPPWYGLEFWKPDPPFDAGDLEDDLARIGDVYREYGYFEAHARSELDWNAEHTEVRVTFVVEEGEPVHLTEVHVHFTVDAGLSEPVRQRLLAGVPLSPGEVFGSRLYARARRALLDALAERGYPAATLEGGARVDLDRHEASVEWTLHPGPLVHFGEIRLTGLEHVDPSLVRRELLVKTGAVYSLAAQRKSEQRLRDTELFRAVAIQSKPQGPGEPATTVPGSRNSPEVPEGPQPEEQVWPVEVRLRERPPRSVRVGGGYGTEEQFRGEIAWRHRNFLGGGRKLELRGEYSSLKGGGELRFLQPHFLAPRTTLGFDAMVARETVPAFDALRSEGRIQLSHRLAEPWRLRGGYRFDYSDVTHSSADVPTAEASSRVSAVFAGIRRDTLDRALDPSRGTWLDFYAEPSLEALGSSASYARLAVEARGFEPWWRLVFAGRIRYGTIEPMLGSGRGDVPFVERLFSGGSTSVRGYDYQSIGPRDDDGDPLGGLSLAEASFEVHARLFWRLSLVGFVDAGEVSRQPFGFRGRDVQFGAGPGLRLDTPVGPLRFDLGMPLNPRPDDPSFRIHLAVGNAF